MGQALSEESEIIKKGLKSPFILSKENKMKITKDNFDIVKNSLREFLDSEINRYIEITGSKNKLGEALGHSTKYVNMIQARNSFEAMEELWRECQQRLKQ